MNILKDLKLKKQLIISTYIIVLLMLIIKPTLVQSIISRIITAFKPFIIGGVIAFLINLPMKLIEEKLLEPICKKYKKFEKISRPTALILTFIIIILLLSIFIHYIAPELIKNMMNLADNIPNYMNELQSYITKNLKNLSFINNISFDIQSIIQKSIMYIGNIINMFISNLFNFTVGVTSFFMNLFLGFIISIYILLSKEALKLQFNKFLYAFFSKENCEKIIYILRLTNHKFSRFIIGQSADGLILGTVFFIVFSLFKIPYALLISIMIPILNFIPIFGTYVGIMISAFIIFMVKPRAVIIFLVLIITIQQLDGKFVYPLVVGNSLGLSPLWILLAIIVGGNLFGVIGMVLGMPLVSVGYELLSDFINERIKKRYN